MRDRILNFVEDVLENVAPLLICLVVVAALLLAAEIVKEMDDEKALMEYNGGICTACGGEFQFDGTSGTVYTIYNYHCPKCGKIINCHKPMIETDGGTK